MTQKPLVVLAEPLFPKLVAEILKPHARVRIARDPRHLEVLAEEADAILSLFCNPIGERLLSKARHLKVIGNVAVGYDNIDLKSCRKRGIRVVNTPGVLTRATAELTLALLMATARRVPQGEALCRSGRFKGWQPDMLLGLELQGRRAVLVGQGRIGSETARLFHGIGLKVEWITRKTSEAEIRKKLRRAQILSLHVPLNRSTRHWLNAKRLALLPHDSIVLNTTRGPIVDEKALIRTLETKRIFGAGLDVYENEPHIPKRLRRLPNAVLLPHLGSATDQTRHAMAALAISGILGVLSGKRPPNEVVF